MQMLSSRTSSILIAVLGLGLLWLFLPFAGSDGPDPVPFAIHRIDMALCGVLVALIAGSVKSRTRRRRRSFLALFKRGVALRVGLMLVGLGLLHLGGVLFSRDYWHYSSMSLGFHVLGPARMMAEQSLVISGLGLCCSSEVLTFLLSETFLGEGVVYLFTLFDALVFTLLGLAGERGVPPFRVFQAVSRIGLSTAIVSLPLAVYRGPIGYWGVEPFAWFFSVVAGTVLISVASKDE
jgi:hypothetical protein